MKNKVKKEIVVILHDIRSAENVGAMFRTADAGGVSKIYLTGYTPTPIDRFGRARKDIAKSALGAEQFVSWEQRKNIMPLIGRLKKEGFEIWSIEQDNVSISYKKVKFNKKTALIMGNEVTGIPKGILKKSDKIIEIPMQGKKESLNVSTTLGIVLFCI